MPIVNLWHKKIPFLKYRKGIWLQWIGLNYLAAGFFFAAGFLAAGALASAFAAAGLAALIAASGLATGTADALLCFFLRVPYEPLAILPLRDLMSPFPMSSIF